MSREQLVGPLVQGFREVLRESAGLEITERTSSTQHASTVTLELTVLVGMVGAIEGQVSYSLSKNFACQFASAMLGDTITDYDDMAESAICELGNMVTGRAAVAFQQEGFDCDLCPPSIILSEKFEIVSGQIDTVRIPFQSDWGNIELFVALTPSPGKKLSTKKAHPAPTITGILTADKLLDDIRELFGTGKHEDALEQTRLLRELNFACSVKLAPLCTEEGIRLFNEGSDEVALRVLEAAVEYDEFSFDAQLYLGHCYVRREAWNLALQNYQRAAGIEPKKSDSYYWAGFCLHKVGNLTKARRAYQVAQQLGHPEAEARLADLPASED